MDDIEIATEAEAIAALGVAAAGQPSVVVADNGRSYLVTPKGYESREITLQHDLERHLPKTITAGVTVQTADSLADYVNRFKGENTILLADIDNNRIVAAIDYHGPDKAALVEHSATLTLPHSFEWKTWSQVSGKLMSQLEFARFLEENGADVKAPDAADLLEVCRDLHAIRKADFKKAVRTSSDNENFEYSVETEAVSRQGGIELPTKFLLEIPVYFGDPVTEVYAFLRWKLDEGQLLLGIVLHRAEHVRQAVFKQHVFNIADRTDRLAVFGKA